MAVDNQSPAEPKPEPALLALAQKTFGALSRAEEELFQAAQEGREASAFTGDNEQDDPVNAATWPDERVVRAKCISWACTDPEASVLVSYRGLMFGGMRVDGDLNLSIAEIKFPFVAWKCELAGNIDLREAKLRMFYLLNCQVRSLDARHATIDGSVLLQAGFKAWREVNLLGIKIGGDLNCEGAQFSNAEGLALNANGAKIEGIVFLGNGFEAKGEVNLVGAKIGVDLDCSGARFSNVKGLALNVNGAKIRGTVFLSKGFKAEGEVNLAAATIGGVLDCEGAQFLNARGCALNAGGAKIESYAFLRQGFQAHGLVNLVGATIGSLQIFDVVEADKLILDLRLTQVETFWDDEGSWPKTGNLFLDGFRYERLFESAPFEADKRKKWLRLQPRDRFRPQPYEQLAAVLRRMGHERDARLLPIEKNRERARFTHFPHQSWWWHNVFGRLIGYGYAPWRAFAMSLAMILLGTFLFAFGSAYGLISPRSENAYAKDANGQSILENGQRKIWEEYPTFNAFFYSLESFTPLLKLDQSANWAPNANQGPEIPLFRFWAPPAGELLRYYLYFHIASGWLLTSLWVGAITGLVKT